MKNKYRVTSLTVQNLWAKFKVAYKQSDQKQQLPDQWIQRQKNCKMVQYCGLWSHGVTRIYLM